MRVAELVLEYLKVLAWPVVVVSVVYLFRQRLHDLLSRIRSFEGPGGVKADFAGGLARVRDRLDQAESEQRVTDHSPKAPPPNTAARTTRLQARVAYQLDVALKRLAGIRKHKLVAGSSTAAAIHVAWQILEGFHRVP